ncbi:MAG: class I SAM-dependent methyltransferase [Gammaproteobacteria bacterium]|nr:class I SAM-dependent methyltransferase [Gammaproteobacteria bacterium]
MTDASFRIIAPYLHDQALQTLCFADENLLTSAADLQPGSQLLIISNRFDVYSACKAQGLNAEFSDYDCSRLPPASFDRIVYRVSKEKPVVHYLINRALGLLKVDAELILAGEKGDGIKTYADKAGKLFGTKAAAQKHGNSYLARIRKTSGAGSGTALDDRDYETVRVIAELDGQPVVSKPGLFGWDKIDAGSEFLVTVAADYLAASHMQPANLLDLGCGYGYLTLCSASWPSLRERWATDNNAAAIHCAQLNADAFGLPVNLSADDCGARIQSQFDLILCNPPFHQGFSVDAALTEKFLRHSRQRLSRGGVALFVVNQFIPLERLATRHYSGVEQLASNGKFKVLALRP